MTTYDPLSKLFRLLRFPNLNVGESQFTPPWGGVVPAGQLSFYAIRSGRCHLRTQQSTTTELLEAGDLVLITDGQEHSLCDTPDHCEFPLFLETSSSRPTPPRELDETARQNPCNFVYGRCPTEPLLSNLLIKHLPSVIRINIENCSMLKGKQEMLGMISQECQNHVEGSESIAEHLVQVLIKQTIRSYIVSHNHFASEVNGVNRSEVLRATADPRIGPVLEAIHAQPGEPWTIIRLARQSRMSKSAFSERFRDMVGQSPMQYITALRIQQACEMLVGTDIEIKQIASLVGYESASSFSNAFSRELGRSPKSYRQDGNLCQNGNAC